jgi:hypothetical protein
VRRVPGGSPPLESGIGVGAGGGLKRVAGVVVDLDSAKMLEPGLLKAQPLTTRTGADLDD